MKNGKFGLREIEAQAGIPIAVDQQYQTQEGIANEKIQFFFFLKFNHSTGADKQIIVYLSGSWPQRHVFAQFADLGPISFFLHDFQAFHELIPQLKFTLFRTNRV